MISKAFLIITLKFLTMNDAYNLSVLIHTDNV